MTQRRSGPTRGAGVAIIEQEGGKSIEPSALGWVGYAGILEKGPVGELSQVYNKTQFLDRHGSYIDDSTLPDAALGYFDLANGAGGMLVVRVTDGNESAAFSTIYQRKVDGSEPIAVPMGKIEAKNGGRWGGKKYKYTNDMTDYATDLTETTLDTGVATFSTDQLKGGYIELEEVADTQYTITGNTAAGVISVDADQTMLSDFNDAGGSDSNRYYVVLENEEKEISYIIGDGEDSPDTEFSLAVYVDGVFFKKYANLSTNPTSARYWVNLINNDDSNDQIEVTDLVTGAHVADTRPANFYGVIGSVTETILTANIFNFDISSPVEDANPTCALGTTTDEMVRQTITITMTGATAGSVVSDKFGSLGDDFTTFDEYVPNNKWSPPFTLTAGGTPLVADDVLTIDYIPFELDALTDGFLYPDKNNAKLTKFRILSNTHKTITVVAGSDLTADGETDDEFLVEVAVSLGEGVDGNADIADSDYLQQAWDVDLSPFNRLEDRDLGLVKFATPGVTATAVQQAGVAYADAKNHQYRYEIPSSTTTEVGAITLINDTLGRSDYAVVSFPSYGDVPDPDGGSEGKLKEIPLTGMIHGREARMAADNEGYHKAGAGLDATLPSLLQIPTGEAVLNHETLNPVGISVIRKKKGNFVIWGDRTLYTDSTWKFKHHRELMSYYEQVLQANFDWIVFAINDPDTDKIAYNSIREFFKPEWAKRAIRGDDVDDAAIIKVDSENNTDATRAAGETFADIELQLADVVERFIIRIGKQGIFESVG
jgi:hypothetical protein